MAGIEADIAAFEAKLGGAILNVLQGEVSELAKDKILEELHHYAFPYSRGAGGLSDRASIRTQVSGGGDQYELVAKDEAPFQGTGGSGTLADVVESGNPAYHMPGARPFMKPAEAALVGPADAAIQAAVSGI